MAALHGALAFAVGAHVAVRVGHHLHFDVARLGDVALEEDRGVAEGRSGLGARGAHGVLELLGLLDEADAAATAAGGGLHHQREADALAPRCCAVAKSAASMSFAPGTTGTPAPSMSLRAETLSPSARIAERAAR